VAITLITCWSLLTCFGQQALVETESFDDLGGWTLDTQFTFEMGSPYLLAHGLGRPVEHAKTQFELPGTGRWQVWARTKDWVARWGAEGSPGRFQIAVNGEVLAHELGTQGMVWSWHEAGVIEVESASIQLELRDLTGFDGRCDAVYFCREGQSPPPGEAPRAWRNELLGNTALETHDGYDLVVVGGGYSGMGAALSAARMGCRVALIQDRPVLGGNGSSEIRVWSKGHIRRGKYPRIGEIIEEFADEATRSPGLAEEFGDELKEQIVRAEPNIDLFLMHRMDGVRVEQSRIQAVEVLDIRSGQRREFAGQNYCDATGHGWLAAMAGADGEMTPDGRMGMSNMWRWEQTEQAVEFSAEPWALDLEMEDFPYPWNFHAEWFWESGYDKDPLQDAEAIRDWNFRAAYGAFHAMKNRGGAAEHLNARMTWLAAIGGPRESRRFFGDVILDEQDIVTKRDFPDGCVPSTWTIDLHYPKKQYAKKFPDNPFISIAVHDARVDREFGYPVPYRCFYSRNISNLFLAGRCISVTHEALGTVRVMRTCGMMGEVVGKAASICARREVDPRAVYADHWTEMDQLLQLPGVARRESLNGEVSLPAVVPASAGAFGPLSGLNPAHMAGVVIDDRDAEIVGDWGSGNGLAGHIGWGYRYASPDTGARAKFLLTAPKAGSYEVRIGYREHENRGSRVSVWMGKLGLNSNSGSTRRFTVDMRQPPTMGAFEPLGMVELVAGQQVEVSVSAAGAGGLICIDACQLIEVDAN